MSRGKFDKISLKKTKLGFFFTYEEIHRAATTRTGTYGEERRR